MQNTPGGSDKLTAYIAEAQISGFSAAQIQATLVEAGWSAESIATAFTRSLREKPSLKRIFLERLASIAICAVSVLLAIATADHVFK